MQSDIDIRKALLPHLFLLLRLPEEESTRSATGAMRSAQSLCRVSQKPRTLQRPSAQCGTTGIPLVGRYPVVGDNRSGVPCDSHQWIEWWRLPAAVHLRTECRYIDLLGYTRNTFAEAV